MAVFAAEVIRRRTFLRTNAVLTRLGPGLATAALHWPFGRAMQVLRCLYLFLLLSILHSAIWGLYVGIVAPTWLTGTSSLHDR
jgi:hypothetical protein